MFFILSLFVSLFQTPSQDPLSFEALNASDGLSNNNVYAILQDQEGYIWMTTDNGLNKYDGYEFEQFYHDVQDSTSISSSIVRAIIEDNEGTLWVVANNGLNRYQRETNSFKRYYPKNLPDKHRGLNIKSLHIDGDGKIWFTLGNTLGYFNTEQEQFEFIATSSVGYTISIQDNGQAVWLDTANGRFYTSGKQQILRTGKNETILPSNALIHFGSYSNTLWVPYQLEIEALENDQPFSNLPKQMNPTALLEIDANTLLIGTQGAGLFQYDIPSQQLTKWQLDQNESILNLQIRHIYKDKNEGLWVSTLGGVYHYDRYRKPFKHLDIDPHGNDIIMGVSQAAHGSFVNVFGKALYHRNPNTLTFEKLNTPDYLSQSNGFYIYDLEEIPEHKFPLWMATSVGVFCYDYKNNIAKKVELPVLESDNKESFAILNTAEDYFWVTANKTIYKVSKKEGKLLGTFSLASFIPEANIQKMMLFDKQFFVGTENSGLFLFDEQSASLKKLSLKDRQGTLRDFNTSVWDLYNFDNTLWVGTSKGLYQVKKNENVLTAVVPGSQIIYSIISDDYNNLWMGSEKGLFQYTIAKHSLRLYDTKDGVVNTEFNRRSVFKTEDGRLWFGGIQGMTVFNPKAIQTNPVIPPVYIRSFSRITSDTTYVSLRPTERIKLPWNQSTISLDYVALNYTNVSQNQYKHQLVGYDPDWVVNTTSREARYVQLPPGDYTFKIIAANNDGIWNEKGDQLQIIVNSPFWKTWWFRGLMIIIIALGTWMVYSYRLRKLLEVERMKLRIASDLHDEIGSGLSGIALTSDILEQQLEQGAVKPHLISRITTNARNLATNLDDIVWLINPKKETLGDFSIKLKTVAKELMSETTIQFEEQLTATDKKKLLPAELKRNILLLSKEAIHNISKHADAKEVKIAIKMAGAQLHLEFNDDGKGFDSEIVTSGTGLLSMHHRAKLLKANLLISSKPEIGTRIHITLKIP